MYFKLIEQFEIEPFPLFDKHQKKNLRKKYTRYYKKCIFIDAMLNYYGDKVHKQMVKFLGATIINDTDQDKGRNLTMKDNKIDISCNENKINFDTMTSKDFDKLNLDDPIIIKQLGIESFIPSINSITNEKQYDECFNYMKKNIIVKAINELHREKTWKELVNISLRDY
jgi:hypothetical protein